MGSEKHRALLGSELAIGHCIILNECEQPCCRMLAVVTSIDETDIYAKYLSPRFKSYNQGSGMKIDREQATPVNRFGVTVKASVPGSGFDCEVMCEQMQESAACYRDFQPRKWQGRESDGMWLLANTAVMKIAIAALEKSDQSTVAP